MRILRGEVPYADFQTLYTPGQYYLTAAAFRAFGATFDVASRLNFALMALQAWIAWHVAARISGSRFAALLALLAGLAFTYPYPALALALVALCVAARAVRRDSVRLALGAGAVAGLAAWFRQDVGLVAALAVLAVVWTGTVASRGTRIRRVAAAGAAAILTLAILLAPALLRAPERLYEGLVTNPAATVPFRTAGGGVAGVFHAEWFFGAIAVLAALGGGLGVLRVFGRAGRSGALLAGVGLLTLWSLRYLCLRPETHHLVPAGILVGVLGSAPYPRACGLRLLAFVACTAAVVVPLRGAVNARAAQMLGRRDAAVASVGDVVPGASTFCVPAGEADAYRALLARLVEVVPPGGTFLSACSRHDRIHDQDLLLYFATGRPAVPFDWHFDPGVTTREDVQRRIVEDCERAKIRVVVRCRSAAIDTADAPPAGSRVLDDWIAAHFAAGETFGRYAIWLRR